MPETGTLNAMVEGAWGKHSGKPAPSLGKAVIGDSREVMMQGVVAQADGRPEFGPERAGRIDRIGELTFAIQRITRTFIGVSAQGAKSIDEADHRRDAQ